ncbi:MAG TPA: VWA domain-containing protein [Terriglobales bacterium]|nr:VWA domain-containing protein [Terriglobales bacterium]
MSRVEPPFHYVLAIIVLLSIAVLLHAQTTPPQGDQHPSSATAAQTNGANPNSAPATQASKPSQQQQRIYESASVLKAVTRLVVVDVVATDKKGEPVTGLNQSDFSILEDGKDQAVKVFSFQQPKHQDASIPPAQVKENLPSNIYSNIPSYRPDGALNVILLDGLNTTLPNQAYVRDQMIRYLDRMPDDRPVAVYALAGPKLRLLQDFTTDRSVLKNVVRKLKSSSSPLLDNPAGGPPEELLPPGVADSGMLPASVLDAMMSFEQERTATQTDLRIAYTLTAMSLMARQLAGYPGRKNLVWVSEAFPLNIDPDMELRNVFTGSRNYGPEIAAAATEMTDAQIAVYPVDARGLVASQYFSAASTGRDQFGRSLTGARLGSAMSSESAALQAAHGSMEDLAERTGGRATYNRNDIDGAIRHSFDDGSTYYTLAYYPSNKKWDGKFRKIRVKVDRGGIKLRYRLGYYAMDPKVVVARNQKQQTAIFSDAMSLDTPLATALLFHAGVIVPPAPAQNTVVVNFGIDAHAMSFDEDNAGLRHARAECAVTAFTEKGKYVKSVSGVVASALKPDTFTKVMQSYYPCRQIIELPPGSYVLRLGVRDLSTGLLGTTNGRVTVPVARAQLEEKKQPVGAGKQ